MGKHAQSSGNELGESTARATAASLGEQVTRLAHRLEPEFVRLTDGLAALHTRASELSRLGDGMARTVTERVETIRKGGIGALLAGSYAALQASLEQSSTRLDGLVSNTEALSALHGLGMRLRGVAVRLRVVRLGFSIECARLGEESGAFADFVKQLVELEGVVVGLGSAMVEQAAAARAEQSRSGERIRLGLTELRQLGGRCEAVSRSAANGIDGLLETCARVAGQIAAGVRAIETQSGELVYFLQFGDIVRQKLEHSAQGLARAGNGEVALPTQMALQSAQLGRVRDEVAAANGKLGGAFGSLGDASLALVHAVVELAEAARGGTGMASIAGLLDDVQSMQQLRDRADRLGVDSATAAGGAAEVAARMAAHLDDIQETNARMHMMALNAIVNTSRLGQSAAALSVLSIQVHELAKESGAIVTEVLPLLDRVRATADAIARPGTGAAGRSASDVEASVRVLTDLVEHLAGAGAGARELADGQGAALAQARRDVGFLGAVLHEVDGLVRSVDAARKDLAPVPSDAASVAQELAAYTMESEREVHRAVLGGEGNAEPVAAGVAGGDLGDNVELF